MLTSDPLAGLTEYEIRHLPAHLEEAGRFADLHGLLRLEWSEPGAETGKHTARNAWFGARERLGDLAGYLDDVRRAWGVAQREAESELARGEPASRVGLEVRYALLSASVRSLSARVPPDLLAAVVETGIWEVERAVARAQSIPDLDARVEALVDLIPSLEQPQAARVLEETLRVALNIEYDWPRARALIAIAPRLPESLLPRVLEAVDGLEDVWARCRVLSALAPLLPEPMLLQALEAAEALEDHARRAEELHLVAPYLPEPLKARAVDRAFDAGDRALAAARGIEDRREQAAALAGLVPTVRPKQKSGVAEEALGAAGSDEDRTRIGLRLAPHLGESGLSELADTVSQIAHSPAELVDAWLDLVPYLAEPQKGTVREHALARAREIEDARARAGLLAKLAAHVEPPERRSVLEEALAARSRIGDEVELGKALRPFIPHLPEPDRDRALVDALAATMTQVHGDPAELRWSLEELVPHMSEPLLADALLRSAAIDNGEAQAVALTTIGSRMPGPPRTAALERALAEAVRAAQEIESPGQWPGAVVALAAHLPEPDRLKVLRRAVAAAGEIDDPNDRWRALDELAVRLPEPDRSRVLRQAVAVVRETRIESRPDALEWLAPHLPEPVLDAAIAVADALPDREIRATALWLLAADVRPPRTSEVQARTYQAAEARTRALFGRRQRPEHQRGASLASTARTREPDPGPTVQWSYAQAVALATLAPRSPEALGALAPYLSASLLYDAWEEASRGSDTEVGVAVGQYLPERLFHDMQIAMWEQQQGSTLSLASFDKRKPPPRPMELHDHLCRSLEASVALRTRPLLLPRIPSSEVLILGGPGAAREAGTAILDVGRWFP